MANENKGKMSPCLPEYIEGFFRKEQKILEIGSGEGVTLSYMQNIGYDIVGTDSGFSSNPDVIRCSSDNLPFEDASFDAVLMECVFSLCNPQRTSDEIRRVLKPGGSLLLTDLFSKESDKLISGIKEIKNIYSRKTLESYFNGFAAVQFEDHTEDMLSMMCSMIFSDCSCAGLSSEEIKKLAVLKPSYGLWIYKKPAE